MNNAFIHNFEIERKVLATCLTSSSIYDEVRERLSLDKFQDLTCRKVYGIMEQMTKDGKTPTMAEVGTIISTDGYSIAEILCEGVSSYELTKQYIDTLTDLQIRRSILQLAYKAQNIVTDPFAETDDVQKLLKEFDEVLVGKSDDVQPFADVMTSLQNDVASRKEGAKVQGWLTGLQIFDRHFGWHGGDLVIMAGETSQGKTTLATTIARNMAKGGIPCAFYSLEMSSKQMAARLVAGDTQVRSSDMLYSRLTDEQYNRFYDTTAKMKDMPIYFDESSKNTIQGIMRSIRKLVRKHGVKVVFIDYLQILANGGRLDSREQIIGDMARDLKRLAGELDICIVALSQLARQAGKDKSSTPSINRLRGSGQIEEAADIVVLIHRPDLMKERATIYIAKGRNIGLDQKDVKFNAEFSFFADYEITDPNAPYEQNKGEILPF